MRAKITQEKPVLEAAVFFKPFTHAPINMVFWFMGNFGCFTGGRLVPAAVFNEGGGLKR